MRFLLIDEHKFSWDEAFEVTCRKVFSYTNHTLMSEALETGRWICCKILPRHLQIIFEINILSQDFAGAAYPNDTDCSQPYLDYRRVPTGRPRADNWLAVVVSHKVNGVSELHSRLMVESLFAEFAKIFPMRFINVTNGVTPRRWLALANPPLSKVLDEHIGRTWRTDLSQLDELKAAYRLPDGQSGGASG